MDKKKDDFVAYLREEGDSYYLVVVNYSNTSGCTNVPIYNIEGHGDHVIYEAIDEVEYVRNVDTIRNEGLIVCLNAWQSQIFKYNF